MPSRKAYIEKEKEIIQFPYQHLIFMDEVGETVLHPLAAYKNPSFFPVMTVIAVVVPAPVYKDVLMPGMDDIKQKFFKNKNIIFHSREIRRRDGIYKKFLDEELYAEFKQDINDLFERSALRIVSSSINKVKLYKRAQEFKVRTGDDYNIGDLYLRNVEYVLERVGHLLGDRDGKIVFEIRGRRESRLIQGVLDTVKQKGSWYYPKDSFEQIDDSIAFFNKRENINGLQVADYCAYPFARNCKNPRDPDNKLFSEVLKKFVYRGEFGLYGLKEWP